METAPSKVEECTKLLNLIALNKVVNKVQRSMLDGYARITTPGIIEPEIRDDLYRISDTIFQATLDEQKHLQQAMNTYKLLGCDLVLTEDEKRKVMNG